ncbi:unnamed protein product [Lactuca virosa]|uniref:Uncharacterized protein n=1 Tax=Lactuca virosa TaxID=75947 RepID=A0AAU9MP99_9ASTR|nr:unnamed protein product [Lactuca virosa]
METWVLLTVEAVTSKQSKKSKDDEAEVPVTSTKKSTSKSPKNKPESDTKRAEEVIVVKPSKLFSCGTRKGSETQLVEWNVINGAIKREYSGLRKKFMGVVDFDTLRNRFLAAGDGFHIKFWDMDSIQVLKHTYTDARLHASPRLRFNKEGSLLAVTTCDNGIIILANDDGQRFVTELKDGIYSESRHIQFQRLIQKAVRMWRSNQELWMVHGGNLCNL